LESNKQNIKTINLGTRTAKIKVNANIV